jgi:hypothetical protein
MHRFFEVVFVTRPDHEPAEPESEACLEIDSVWVSREIRDHELCSPEISHDLVVDVFDVLNAIDADDFKAAIVRNGGVYSGIVSPIQIALERHRYKARARHSGHAEWFKARPSLWRNPVEITLEFLDLPSLA